MHPTTRTPAKKNALEMMPVAITNAKQPGSRAAISAVSQRTKGLKARALFALRRLSGCGTLRRLLMRPRTFVRKGLPSPQAERLRVLKFTLRSERLEGLPTSTYKCHSGR